MLTQLEKRLCDAAKAQLVSMGGKAKFGESLHKLSAVSGASKTITVELTNLIREMVMEQENWITFEDVELAGKLNATKALPAESEALAKSSNEAMTHVQVYGEINAPIFFAIMKRYKLLRNAALAKMRNDAPTVPVERQLEMPIQQVTDEQWMEMHKTDLTNYSKGSVIWQLMAGRMVKWLYDSGRVTDDSFNADEWKRMRVIAKKVVCDRDLISKNKLNRMNPSQRREFDTKCLTEVRTVLYGYYMQKEIAKSKLAKA